MLLYALVHSALNVALYSCALTWEMLLCALLHSVQNAAQCSHALTTETLLCAPFYLPHKHCSVLLRVT